MSYHNCGRKEKVTRYYIKNKEVFKENVNNKYRILFEEEKVVKREYGRNRYRNMTKTQAKRLLKK